MTKDNNNHPIQWVEDEDFCRWKGQLMGPETCIKLFGTDSEFYADGDGYCLIGGTLYGSVPNYKKDGNTLEGIEEVLPYSELSLINIVLLKEHSKDLDDYYDRMLKNNWENIPNESLYSIF